ncbi:hypothetical protein SPRG_01945 [Saprolegnia parasitica CBS 223.65]|uniref:PDZ domain-containing protein n=1 Tax=Saprolegnia parasitica (strain CBS 223.65) TaxID=695850 RepID=A0A067CRL2_SAPPC|nr:hypothetical protein SPRG_01945 [Saprolegnia parasitica CBS 223.65]KDO33133.1 hypothetical protein SPRG_01945 [Saprolegnia parasitica CBS 223.65]|eukprot:XP_012195898.1 hypothetical protein SPRG_01945 [Saprolegnia parasitica CBS 223.65]
MHRSNNAAPVLDLPSLKAPDANGLEDVDGWSDYTSAHELPEASGSDDELDIALVSTRLLPATAYETPMKQRAYDVRFDAGPLGLELERDWSGELTLVKSVSRAGPAEASSLIRIGDVLHAIDHVSCLDLSLLETQSRLASPGPHTLHFTSPCSFSQVERDVCIAKQCIYEHKARFYRPVETHCDLLFGCIERYRGDDITSFHLHREDTGEFLLACSCESDLSGPFLFHTLRDTHLRRWKDLPRGEDSAVYMGELVANFLGTEFHVLDHARRELGFFVYDSNVLGRCPNSLVLALNCAPHTAPPSERYKKRQQARDPSVLDRLRLEVESFVEALTSPRNSKPPSPEYNAVTQDDDDLDDLALFQTTKPAWNEAMHAWTLPFDGRVHVPSKKNFLLSDDAHQGTVLRFGKVSKVRFTLDFQAPLSPLMALAVAVSAFAKKRIVTS